MKSLGGDLLLFDKFDFRDGNWSFWLGTLNLFAIRIANYKPQIIIYWRDKGIIKVGKRK